MSSPRNGSGRTGSTSQLGCTSVIGSALVILKIDPFWERAIDGALLLGAIALDRLLMLRISRALQKRSGRHG